MKINNFSAGPSKIPKTVAGSIQKILLIIKIWDIQF